MILTQSPRRRTAAMLVTLLAAVGVLVATPGADLGQLSPGQSVTRYWNNASLDENVYAVGVLASQPSSGSCAMQVTTEYRAQPDGEHSSCTAPPTSAV